MRAGTFDAVGDGNPVPDRAGCPRLEWPAPGRAECPPPASGGGDPVRHSADAQAMGAYEEDLAEASQILKDLRSQR